MARFKDFGAPFDAASAEKLTFKLYGEEFECYPEMQGKTLLGFVEMSASEDNAQAVKAISSFFANVLTPESNERFDALASDPERIVNVVTLTEIISWIMEQYSDRPTLGS